MKKAPPPQQLEFGLYLAGRGIRGAQLARPVDEALRDIEGVVAQAAVGESPQDSLEALEAAYPGLRPLLVHGRRGMSSAETESSRSAESKPSDDTGAAPGLPEIELEDGLVWARPLGHPRQMPEWYRPGSAPR